MALNQSQLEKYADTLVWGVETARGKNFKPYEVIMVRFDTAAVNLAECVYRKLIQRKINVIARAMGTPTMEKDFFIFSDKKQRSFVNAGEKEMFGNLNGNIFISAPTSLTHLKDVDPKKIGEVSVARKPLRKIIEHREELGKFGWTLCTFPTDELAKRAGLSLSQYTQQIIKACFLDEKDPVKKWEQIKKDSTAIKKWLNSLPIKTIRVETNNMDLEVLYGEKRRFLGVSGHNVPSFEIFTSPDWRGTRGEYYANLPSYRSGNYVEGIRLEFKKGRAVKISAKKGADFVKKMLNMDKNACQIGEFSLTDKRFSKIDRFMADILFDENFGGNFGNCHIAVGAAYSDTYAGDVSKLTPDKK